MIHAGYFSPLDREIFRPITEFLLTEDTFMVLADFAAYAMCQKEVARVFKDREDWTRRAIRNVAAMGKFSSDRTIREYSDEVWGTRGVDVEMTNRR